MKGSRSDRRFHRAGGAALKQSVRKRGLLLLRRPIRVIHILLPLLAGAGKRATSWSCCSVISKLGPESGMNELSPSLFLRISFHLLPDLQSQVRQCRQADVLARVQRTESLLHCWLDSRHQLLPSPMQQPPTKSKIAPIGLKVIAQCLCQIIIVVFQADSRVRRRSGKGNHAREVVPAAKKVELNAGEDGEQRESVDEGERPRNS